MFVEKECRQCKKTFICPAPTKWKYKVAKQSGHWYFCKWSCMRAYKERKRDDDNKM